MFTKQVHLKRRIQYGKLTFWVHPRQNGLRNAGSPLRSVTGREECRCPPCCIIHRENGLFLNPALRCKILREWHLNIPHIVSGEAAGNSCTRHTIPFTRGMVSLEYRVSCVEILSNVQNPPAPTEYPIYLFTINFLSFTFFS